MALYQPTNVIPSSYTKGTVDVNDTMEISWQVNGNSAMTAFQIDFYLNDANSTPVTSTGKLPKQGETQSQYGLPFYGTDRFGRPQFFTWNPDKTWSSWSLNKFTNGNEYKYKIIQFYEGQNEVISIQSSTRLDASTTYYFTFPSNSAYPNGWVEFYTSNISYGAETQFNYSITTGDSWIGSSTFSTNISLVFHKDGTPTGTNLGVGTYAVTNELFVEQNSFNVILAQTNPRLTIWQTDSSYSSGKQLSSTLTTSIGYFLAVYVQAQNIPIKWIRWQVATATYNIQTEEWTLGDILADTGDIYTPTLHYEFNGFLNNRQYALRATAESESGQECDSGWKFFTINIENQGKYSGDFTIQCLNKENAVLLKWDSLIVIPYTVSPMGYEPTFRNGYVYLNPVNNDDSSVTWDKMSDNDGALQNMSFAAPWTAVWCGYVADSNLNAMLFDLNSRYISLVALDKLLTILYNYTILVKIPIPDNAILASIIINDTKVYAYFYSGSSIISSTVTPISYEQLSITSVTITSGVSGIGVGNISIYNGSLNEALINELYANPNFEPVWDSDQYKLYMTANFNGNLEGGTGTTIGAGFRVYRQEVGKNVLTPITTVPSTTTSVKDYGIVSRKAYKYSLYAYDNNGAFMSAVENEQVVATSFKNYSLLVCDYDEEKDEYHVRKQYLFSYNLGDGSVGNNNSPTLNANFTRYPTRMPSTQNYASGVLTGLIGVVYTVPALVEQIGNYKVTMRPTLLDYFDSVELERELYDLSTAPYQLFLRDMKGRLRMIHTNSAISMTTNIKQQQQSISISFPWVEIGDATDVTIIQTPDDYGWNNDNQVLDVQLDVDVATGELSATYPFPYNGTKFYLTGVNKETLTAKTPLGVAPAQFNLSETATQPDDGKLNAAVKVNSEESK